MLDSFTQQFTKQPADMVGITVVVCTHAIHGIYQFYLPDEIFQSTLMSIVRSAWVNGFVVVIYPGTM